MTGALELMRGLGLLVDGPAAWGGTVRSRAPGVFVVELPGGAPDAPIDPAAIRAWLARVPGMRVDGEPATLQSVAARLRELWLPGEPVLYVGRSAKSLGARVAAMLATPLGDARPFAGGYLLRTLTVLPGLRLWWAETDAFEEYEDGLLSAVVDRSGRLPFANLVDTAGSPKGHGIGAALREPTEDSRPTAAGSVTPKPPRRAPRAATPRRRTAPRGSPAGPPASAHTYLSADGLAALESELEHLRSRVRPGVIERVAAARALGDLRENSEYESARKEQSFVEGRIQSVEALLRTAVVVDARASADAVAIGSTVVVDSDGEEHTFVLVGSTEADPSTGRISYSSPVGAALLGRAVGDEVVVRLPVGQVRYTIRALR